MKYVGLFIFIVSLKAVAAPQPATSTSALTAPEQGLYLLDRGFSVKTSGTSWLPVPNHDSHLESVRFAEKGSGDKEASLTLRSDKLAKNVTLEMYTKKWLRDYASYGFEVLASKNIQLNGNPALLVDMLSRSKGKQIRQVVLKKDSEVAIMTCIDDRETFRTSLLPCNQIIKSFSWK